MVSKSKARLTNVFAPHHQRAAWCWRQRDEVCASPSFSWFLFGIRRGCAKFLLPQRKARLGMINHYRLTVCSSEPKRKCIGRTFLFGVFDGQNVGNHIVKILWEHDITLSDIRDGRFEFQAEEQNSQGRYTVLNARAIWPNIFGQ